MSSTHLWCDGRILPAAEARIDPTDRALLYGEGLFETLRCYRGAPFALESHLRRLRAAARAIDLPLRIRRPALARGITELLAVQDLERADAGVRITVTGGLDGGGPDRPRAGPPRVFMTCRPATRPRSPQAVAVATVQGERFHRSLPGLKTLAYLPALLARRRAHETGADEALVLTEGGELLEATTANVFLRVGSGDGDTLVTPRTDGRILPGVTRTEVLQVARGLGLPVEERRVMLEEVRAAREILLTGSVREVAAVTTLDGEAVGRGRPGPWARALFRAYRARALAESGGRR